MKRILAFILTITLFVIMPLSISACAESNTYKLDELELQITIPPGYSVITRDTPASEPIFGDLGTSKSEIDSLFETGNIYLDAIHTIWNEEVVVTMTETYLADFSLLSDTVLEAVASIFLDQYASHGINVSKYEIYQNSQAKFVKIYFTDTAKTVHGLQYCTVLNGKVMNFTMRSYEGDLSSRQELAIKIIVNSIKCDKAPPISETGEDTNVLILGENGEFAIRKNESYIYNTPLSDLTGYETTDKYFFENMNEVVCIVHSDTDFAMIDYFPTDNNSALTSWQLIERCFESGFGENAGIFDDTFTYKRDIAQIRISSIDDFGSNKVYHEFIFIILEHGIVCIGSNSSDESVYAFVSEIADSVLAKADNDFILQ